VRKRHGAGVHVERHGIEAELAESGMPDACYHVLSPHIPRGRRHGYAPLKEGARFSWKASVPSLASSEAVRILLTICSKRRPPASPISGPRNASSLAAWTAKGA